MRVWKRRSIVLSVFILIISAVLSGCSQQSAKVATQKTIASMKTINTATNTVKSATKTTKAAPVAKVEEPIIPMGKSDGVFYEIFVRSFYDSNGDSIGDINGITEKLDYLKDLGVKGIWLMPINPSPSYHGYDVTDYLKVNPQYGTMKDVHHLLDEAHKRGIKVIMDLVANHTSDQHPWFKASASSKNSKYRNWYVWAEDTGQSTSQLGALGTNPWHELNGAHYLGIFWKGMPDLNYDNPDVRKEMVKVGQFWLKQGMDGFRLDAAKHIFGDFQSNVESQETVKKNLAWWQQFRTGLNSVNKKAYVVGEVWDSAAMISPYLDKAFNSSFNFDLAKSLIAAAQSEQSNDIAYSLQRIYGLYSKVSHGQFVDAPILSNHDQNRVMSDLDGNVDHAKMAAGLLLTMPGNPFIYYGEEIGMKGKKPDERIRESMQWYKQAAKGQTTWGNSLYNLGGNTSVEAESSDAHSLLNYYKMLIHWRNNSDALANGDIAEFSIDNTNVMAYERRTQTEKVLVIHNLSDQKQTVNINQNGTVPYAKIAFQSKAGVKLSEGNIELPPYTTVVLK